ncbi:NAD(P)-dependent oxidoreductase [Chroococcidiopsis sp. FACHB-1243]|uniref:NAD(P)-dependent oxidoreductase n=1 Tax=Chroococcidiopsis sp. [FACHB-1243] TaxID=2692781 RepID=UPI00177F8295|nr:NAD(P)-dependent oxidoreductase [Chroococcidiopsis sp. [FACHB-1243]]MBD2308080.1 NAD(P)-dependent oxidoreductase [Chroococcidiopsis sp. [FACHB-1243]]
MSRIAVLGIGAMGSRVAQNLLKANHQVVVYNRTAEKAMPLVNQGAIYAATPREAAEQADIVISMVADNDVSRAVWCDSATGAVLGLRKDAIAIESSTLTVDWTTELAKEITSRGVAFLDAPVVGSRPQADAGKLIYLVGGETETLAQVQNILLSAGAATIHHVGSAGQGMAMKLAVNALFGIQVAALAEVVGILTKNGVTSAKAIECLGELPVISPAAKVAGSLMLAQNHAPLFPIELVEKDFRYVIQTAQAVEASIPASTAVRDIYQTAIANGYGSDNITGVAQLFI